MAGLAVGGWFASVFIDKLSIMVSSYISDQYEYQKGIKGKLKSLEASLIKIQGVIHMADQRQIENPGLSIWLKDLKEAAYDAEDVLDLFEYQLLRDQVSRRNKVRSDFASASYTFIKQARSVAKRILFPDDHLDALLRVIDRFDKIVTEMGNFIKLVDSDVSPKRDGKMDWRVTTSIPTESRVFGREKETENIIKLLLDMGSDYSSGKENVQVLPIVGIGGVGKTTLTQCIYNDQSVKDHFDVRVWVCVSEKFDVKRLTVEMIESVSVEKYRDSHNLHNLDSIQEILQMGLEGKRFLIVLDDVWNEVRSKWETLRKPFEFGSEGSKVVITTRIPKVAEMMGTMTSVALHGLEDEDFWKFFVKCSFGSKSPIDHPILEPIGRQIAKRLGGLPLAAKTVGGVLKSKLEEGHWKEILEHKLWQIEQYEDGILPVLRISYDSLPAHLKQCFVYCSLFPKNYIFQKDRLVRIWTAQGFILPNLQKRIEDIGRAYFEELSRRSFFQKVHQEEERYVIHDLLHDLAQSISSDECFRLEDDSSAEIPKRVHHLYVSTNNLAMVNNMFEVKSLRSLVVHGRFDFAVSLNSLKELKSLRVLILSGIYINSFPESIGKLIHLRYLELEQVDGIEKLPESLCKLYHLQGLHTKHCISLSLPKGIINLINLRYINTNIGVISNTSEIGKLTSLQELENYIVERKNGCEIGQLKDMKQLGGRLKIWNLENVGSKNEASKAMLNNKRHLSELSLVWGDASHIKNAEEVLEGLQPHSNLKKLSIFAYAGTKSPSWLDARWLWNLESVRLRYCYFLEVLPPLGQLPYLKVLVLEGLGAVKQIGLEFYGDSKATNAFPALEKLIFERMHEWKEWTGAKEGCHMFPRLSHLRLIDCPKLRGSLFLPLSVKSLKIWPNNERRLGDEWPKTATAELLIDDVSVLTDWLPAEGLSALQEMTFSNINICSFSNKQDQWFQHLPSLRCLVFVMCDKLQSLPSTLSHLPSLEVLNIDRCDEIQSLPEEGLPKLLKELHIGYCHPQLLKRCRPGGADWLKIAHIPAIKIEGEEIQRMSIL